MRHEHRHADIRALHAPPSGASPSGLTVAWSAPPRVGAFMSLRQGGVSASPFDSLNLGDHVGDDPAAVAQNRERFFRALGAHPVWLRQVHGAQVVDASLHLAGPPPTADASWASQPGIACVVAVADCLPVLLAARNEGAVGAAHAGWRGLAAGVLEAAVEAVCRAAACPPSEVEAWLGPAIGPGQFEVGEEVLQAFGGGPQFLPKPGASHPDGRPRWLADLPALARMRLASVGLRRVVDAGLCTVSHPDRCFSYRRDRQTGRMAAAVWLRDPGGGFV